MKDIKDYIGTKTAIHCKTQEEFNMLCEADTDSCPILPDFFVNFGDRYVDISSLPFQSQPYIYDGFETISASDFMPNLPEEQLSKLP